MCFFGYYVYVGYYVICLVYFIGCGVFVVIRLVSLNLKSCVVYEFM